MHFFNNIIYWLFLVFQIITAIYIVTPFILTLSFYIKKTLGLKNPLEKSPIIFNKNFEFAVIVTAHEETEFIDPIVDSILKQTYKDYYIYVVADACNVSSLNYSNQRVIILNPQPALNAKIKSIQFALESFIKKHDAFILLDSDNLLHPNFLEEMNNCFQKGFKAAQADFKAKNTFSSFEKIDAIGDMYNFFIDRESVFELGLSSCVWGSGIAIDINLYKEINYKDFLGGFDKKLQLHLIEKLPIVPFVKNAILYDEKISSGLSLEKQRARWIEAHFKYQKETFQLLIKSIKKINFNQFFFAFNAVRPPKFILLGTAILFMLLNFYIFNTFCGILWLIALCIYIITFFLVVGIRSSFDPVFFPPIFLIPKLIYRQVLALFKISKAKKSFLKTKHSKVRYIDEVYKP